MFFNTLRIELGTQEYFPEDLLRCPPWTELEWPLMAFLLQIDNKILSYRPSSPHVTCNSKNDSRYRGTDCNVSFNFPAVKMSKGVMVNVGRTFFATTLLSPKSKGTEQQKPRNYFWKAMFRPLGKPLNHCHFPDIRTICFSQRYYTTNVQHIFRSMAKNVGFC